MHSYFRASVILLILMAFCGHAIGEEIRIVTWNASKLCCEADVEFRRTELLKMAQEVEPDILIVQEVECLEVAEALRDTMHLSDYSIACSSFRVDDNCLNSLEVAVLSRFDIKDVIEYDPVFEEDNDGYKHRQMRLERRPELGGIRIRFARGFLWVVIPELHITLSAVHLKSSYGKDPGMQDNANALKRELCAAAVASKVAEDLNQYSDYAHIVAGDFNVSHLDKHKSGKRLDIDSYDLADTLDGYDETHALLSFGLIRDVRMRNLMENKTKNTLDSIGFGPIDYIYVAGERQWLFDEAEIITDTYGSDHHPVLTVYHCHDLRSSDSR